MTRPVTNNISTIPKPSGGQPGTDYAFLRKEGLKYIEQLSHKLWTDYNIHDPGITMLEMLCYAITDLGYRTDFPMEDILASEKDNKKQMHRQFLSAIKALPSEPLSANDYRQLFVRIKGIRNAWILPSTRDMVAQFRDLQQEGVDQLHFKQPGEVVDPDKAHEFSLRGMNRILLDFDEVVLLSKEEKQLPPEERKTLLEEKKQETTLKAMEVYQRFRNLCEDIDTIDEVPQQGVVLCGDIETEPHVDAEQVWAQVVFNINRYLSPDIPFYNLQQMQEAGKTTDEIFEGPVFDFDDDYPWRTPGNPFYKKGFIRKEDLQKSQLRKEVRLSDIINIILKTKGVKLIKELAFGLCACDETDMDKVRKAVAGNKWNLCIEPGYKPVFCHQNSVLNIWKDVIPITLKKSLALQKLNNLTEARNLQMQEAITEDIPIPRGTYRNIASYRSFQNHFPETYGIGRAGLADSAPVARKAAAKQLKAYLLFFEQVLANYFSQLAHVKELLSADTTTAKSYFANVVKDLKESETLFTSEENWQSEIKDLLKSTGLDNYVERRNRFLDHLLARFSEQFNEYVFLMHRIYGEDAGRTVIRNKAAFLQDYHNMSTSRGSGFDYYNPLPEEAQQKNIPGMAKRASRLLGFNHYKQTPLSELSYAVEQTGTTTIDINGNPKEVPVYGWTITMKGEIILESINKEFLKQNDAFEEMGLASLLGCEREYYQPVLFEEAPWVTFTLHATSDQPGVMGEAIAKHPEKYDALEGEYESESFSLVEEAIEQIRDYLLHDFRLEGLYIVEHLLLRPDTDTTNPEVFLPVCIETNGEYCRPLDPYSFRITVVLPGYSMRLRNKNFRQFAERLIRMETPAHILPRICFVGEEHMQQFEEAYNNWLNERITSENPLQQTSDSTLIELIEILNTIFSAYGTGRLSGCNEVAPDTNPVILGSSRLGSLEDNSNPPQPE
ncbi:MAG: hypothetical protein ACOCYD_00080 [bacterium]